MAVAYLDGQQEDGDGAVEQFLQTDPRLVDREFFDDPVVDRRDDGVLRFRATDVDGVVQVQNQDGVRATGGRLVEALAVGDENLPRETDTIIVTGRRSPVAGQPERRSSPLAWKSCPDLASLPSPSLSRAAT